MKTIRRGWGRDRPGSMDIVPESDLKRTIMDELGDMDGGQGPCNALSNTPSYSIPTPLLRPLQIQTPIHISKSRLHPVEDTQVR